MSDDGDSGRSLTVMIIPAGARESHSIQVSYRVLRFGVGAVAVLAFLLTLMAGSWWYLAARASRVGNLEAQISSLEADRAQVERLARRLEQVERRYSRVREMFGAGASREGPDLWLPPPSPRRGRSSRSADGPSLPTSWPLTEKGFVTQRLMDGADSDHPGLDIAVPTDSYVRAAGGGSVVDVGEDPVYGHFVVIDHGDGYRSIYAHGSLNLVALGQKVRQDEVIALSGSTGQSTAPHLHFEILHDGKPVDPLSLVTQPS